MIKKPKSKVLLFYNAYSGNGMFKSNLDHIIEKCQEKGLHVLAIRAQKGVQINKALER